jgi:hypothetical protein
MARMDGNEITSTSLQQQYGEQKEFIIFWYQSFNIKNYCLIIKQKSKIYS